MTSKIVAGEIISLTSAARKIATAEPVEGAALTRRAVHALRVVEQAQVRVPYGCPDPMDARSFSALRRATQVSTLDLPDEHIGAPLLRKSRPALVCLEDDYGRSETLTEAAKIVKAFCRKDPKGQGQMVLDALDLLADDARTWAFRRGLGVDANPEMIIGDLNLMERISDWISPSASWDLGATYEGAYISLREEPDWKRSGVQLHLAYFQSISQALAIGAIVYCFARQTGLTRAWIRDL